MRHISWFLRIAACALVFFAGTGRAYALDCPTCVGLAGPALDACLAACAASGSCSSYGLCGTYPNCTSCGGSGCTASCGSYASCATGYERQTCTKTDCSTYYQYRCASGYSGSPSSCSSGCSVTTCSVGAWGAWTAIAAGTEYRQRTNASCGTDTEMRCAANYYQTGTITCAYPGACSGCTACPANSGSAAGSSSCTCSGGYYPSGGTCQECGVGYFCNNNSRYYCGDYATTSSGLAGVTTVVNSNWNSTVAWDVVQCVCDWYYSDSTRWQYLYENNCVYGPAGNTYTHPSWCNAGYYPAGEPLGWSNWYTSCAACSNKPANSYYTGPGSDWYYVGGSQNDCPWACNANYHYAGGQCVYDYLTCPAPMSGSYHYQAANYSGCSQYCSPGYFMWWDAGIYNCASACVNGYYCPGGTAYAGGDRVIYQCPEGGTSDAGNTSANGCFVGCSEGGIAVGRRYWNGSAYGVCKPESSSWGCHWGYWNNGGQSCEACEPGYYCYNYRNPCTAGFFCPYWGMYDPSYEEYGDTYKCPAQPGQSYGGNALPISSDGARTSAANCFISGDFYYWDGAGYWVPGSTGTPSGTCHWGGSNYDNCTKSYHTCAPGRVISPTPAGAGFVNSCAPCPAGTSGPEDYPTQVLKDGTVIHRRMYALSCPACDAGTYQPSAGQASCAACPAGTYQPNTGQTVCADCAAGTYQPDTGQTSCSLCGGGTYQDQARQTSCTACPPGPSTGGGIYTWNNEHDGFGSSSIYNCYHTNLPYSSNNCSGTVTCYYTSGTGSTAIYNGNHISGCDNYSLTSCEAGYYAPVTYQFNGTIGGACVGNDYWSAAGSAGRTACAASTKSGGCGSGAASASDCTPFKTLRNSYNSSAPILRTVRTAPAGHNLNVSIDGVTYYGNLTETLIPGAIKLEFNGTVYSVTDNATQ